MTTIKLAILAAVATALSHASSLSLLPGGSISGDPGSTIGWGYTITNDTSDWLQPEDLSAPSFPVGITPHTIFDYLPVAPNSSITELFSTVALNNSCTALPCGLFELVLSSGIAPATYNGTFTIHAEYFDGDPANGGSDLGAAPDLTAGFTASVNAPSGAPEPAGFALAAGAFASLAIWRRRRSSGGRS